MDTATDTQEIIDDGDLRKYRTEIPNMADDELDPFQMRLYVHYKRACGAYGRGYVESVRTTAGITQMSVGKVVSTRQWLHDNGWIVAAAQPDRDGSYMVRIVDRWAENFAKFAPKRANAAADGVHQVNGGVHGVNASVHQVNGGVHGVNHKKEQIQEETNKKDLSPAGARVAVVGSNIPLLETETAITPAAKQVPASRYLPKGLHLTGGHIAPGAGQNAVQVYYERFRPDTDRLTCPQEDDLVSGCPDLAKLREVVIAYSQSGYRSCNVKLILDWYRNGIPQHNKPDRPSRRDLQQYNKQTRTTNRPPAPNRGNDNAQTTTPSSDQRDLRPDIAEAIDKLYAGIPTRHDRAAD